mmetsp:Transcript_26766/g.61118  ORF Transcript_26766/g.61118 Transcript_26766/m.61118 type:complete len:282 (-) Transcript_26766:8-853(-)
MTYSGLIISDALVLEAGHRAVVCMFYPAFSEDIDGPSCLLAVSEGHAAVEPGDGTDGCADVHDRRIVVDGGACGVDQILDVRDVDAVLLGAGGPAESRVETESIQTADRIQLPFRVLRVGMVGGGLVVVGAAVVKVIRTVVVITITGGFHVFRRVFRAVPRAGDGGVGGDDLRLTRLDDAGRAVGLIEASPGPDADDSPDGCPDGSNADADAGSLDPAASVRLGVLGRHPVVRLGVLRRFRPRHRVIVCLLGSFSPFLPAAAKCEKRTQESKDCEWESELS